MKSTISINKMLTWCRVYYIIFLACIINLFSSDLTSQAISVCSGLKDIYVCPEEPVTPDASLLNYFTTQNASHTCFGLLEFDNFPGLSKCNGTPIPQNALFIHQMVFPVASGNISAATLQFRAKASPAGQTGTDNISFFEGSTYITGASLNQLVEAGGTWNHNQDRSFSLNLGNLPSAFSITSILSYLNDGDLDIVIGNETGVDWICIDALSEPCVCTNFTFSNMILRPGSGTGTTIYCGISYDGFTCPESGEGFNLTGLLQCSGEGCNEENNIYWELQGPSNIYSGSSISSPYFGISLLPTYFSQTGIYTMSLMNICGSDTCRCEFQFIVDCPELCPCNSTDVIAFSNSVDMGFSQASLYNSCEVCFSPNALSECETVEWHLDNITSTPVGTSVGNQSFCHTIPNPGLYTMIMVVNRKKADGTDCETFTFSKEINVQCQSWSECNDPSIINPNFNEGAIPGGLSTGGSSTGWTAPGGNPFVVEGAEGSSDGWAVLLAGNYEYADVLQSTETICLGSGKGVISLRSKQPKADMRERRPGGIIKVEFISGLLTRTIGSFPLVGIDSSNWWEFQIPFDVTDWIGLDSCNDIPNTISVHLRISVSNSLSDSQGGPLTFTEILIDNVCLDNLVSISPSGLLVPYRIFPNPVSGMLNIQLHAPAPTEMSIRLVSLTGQIISEHQFESGKEIQSVNTMHLPNGMYIIQTVSKNRVLSLNKFVKM